MIARLLFAVLLVATLASCSSDEPSSTTLPPTSTPAVDDPDAAFEALMREHGYGDEMDLMGPSLVAVAKDACESWGYGISLEDHVNVISMGIPEWRSEVTGAAIINGLVYCPEHAESVLEQAEHLR